MGVLVIPHRVNRRVPAPIYPGRANTPPSWGTRGVPDLLLLLGALLLLAPTILALVGLALPRRGGRLWIMAGNPLTGAVARGVLEAREEPEWPPVLGCARYCPRRHADAVLAHAARASPECPPREAFKVALERGLPRAALELALRAAGGCEPGDGEAVYGALALLQGVSPRGATVLLACHGNAAVAGDGETVADTRRLPEWLRQAALESGGSRPAWWGFLISLGCPASRGVRLERLALQVLPEAPPSLEGLAYHLNIPRDTMEGDPARILEMLGAIARRLAWLAKLIPEEHRPPEAQAVLQALGQESVECPPGEGATLTDAPRLACPYYSPYTLEIPQDLRGPLRAVFESLRARRGNPVRAALNLVLSGKREWAETLLENTRPGAPWGVGGQVEPWYAGCARARLKGARCLVSPRDCAHWSGPGPIEALLRSQGLTPPRLECPRPRRAPVPMEPGRGEGVHIIVPGLEPVSSLQALRLAFERLGGDPCRALVVAPSRAAARLLRGVLEGWGLGCARVTSVELLYLEPWVLEGRRLIFYLPEKAWRPRWLVSLLERGGRSYLEASLERLRSIAGRPGSIIVSRAASRALPLAQVEEPENGGPEPEGLERLLEGLVGEAEGLLREHWSPRFALRREQETAIRAILRGFHPPPGRPVLTILPTGAGKSAIFQLTGLLLGSALGGYTLVVSPLRALLRDQVEGLQGRGVPAGRIDAATPPGERAALLEAAVLGLLDFLYVTPERLQDPVFAEALVGSPPPLAVLDEAHTIARWGRGFRPSYLYAARLLADLRGSGLHVHLALFTATASGRIARQVLEELGVERGIVESSIPGSLPGDWEALVLRAPAERPNLKFTLLPVPEGEARLPELYKLIERLSGWASSVSEPWLGVVFTGFVRSERHGWANAEELARRITEATGIPAVAYHGQLPGGERRRREDQVYMASETGEGPRIVVATKAFGMGVDIPNIRWTIHVFPSDSVEDYFQEAGRAGRDGLPSVSVHLYNPEDFRAREAMLRRTRITPSQVVRLYNTLAELNATLRERLGGWQLLLVPLPLPDNPVRTLRSLDTLRGLGLLDYWAVRSGLAAYVHPGEAPGSPRPDEVLPWYMELDHHTLIGPPLRAVPGSWRRVPLRLYRCEGRPGELYPVRVEAGEASVEAGECGEWKLWEPEWPVPVAIVVLSLDREHRKMGVLPPDMYARVARMSVADLEALRDYERLLERAAGEAARHGWNSGEVDRVLREGIRSLLGKHETLEPRPPPGELFHKLTVCPTSAECVERLVGDLVRVGEWLGSTEAVTVAVREEELLDAVRGAYKRLTGKPLRVSPHAYQRVMRASREGPVRLMDLGFILVLARRHPRTLQALERLQGYPYHATYIYHTS